MTLCFNLIVTFRVCCRVVQAYMLPDIVFLPTAATVYALNEPVPTSKPRLVVSAETVAQARGQQQPASQNWQQSSRHGNSHARSTQRRAGSMSRDDGSMPLSPPQTTAAAAAARLPMTPVRWPGTGGMQEGVGSPPAPIQQQPQQQLLPPPQQEHFVPVFPMQLGEHGGSMVIPPLMGHVGTPQPQIPLDLAHKAAQVQAMLQLQQQQLGQGNLPHVPGLLPLLQPMPLGLVMPTPMPQQEQPLHQEAQQQVPPASPALQLSPQLQHVAAPSASSP